MIQSHSSTYGSSPLTRGKRNCKTYVLGECGLIPAHAGKTSRCGRPACGSWAHPRSRGENLTALGARGDTRGSSPLTRGKPCDQRPFEGVWGLIPAHAGKTSAPDAGAVSGEAHPRSRGENARGGSLWFINEGSSPLTRGKLIDASAIRADGRLIPAHAGKTSRPRATTANPAAHPRSRGENGLATLARSLSCGSSPLTRGKLLARAHDVDHGRLIPAHAGKTPPISKTRPARPAHPRSRGENDRRRNAETRARGSSPLTRGKRAPHGPLPYRELAHPRSRGENMSAVGSARTPSGSSPLTRGKQ